MRYFLRPWDECRPDTHADWGTSLWYFEVDELGYVVRQVEAYRGGQVLKYDEANLNDEFGGLAEKPLDLDEFAEFEIAAEEFHGRWIIGGGSRPQLG